MKNKKGFTLIELLVVVLIIGILAAIALPQYKMAVLKSSYAELKVYTKTIYDAVQRYYIEKGDRPTKFEQLDIEIPGQELNNHLYIPTRGNPKISCHIWCDANGNDCKVRCDNGKIEYGHCFKDNNRRFCRSVTGNNTIESKLCEAETGKTTGTYRYY